MPLRREEISNTARNHTLNGFLVFSNSVPDNQAGLVVAVAALEQEATALRPHALATAARARRLAAPARLDPIGSAGFLRCKPPVELDRRLREIPPQIILVACHPPPPCRWSDRTQLRRSYGNRYVMSVLRQYHSELGR